MTLAGAKLGELIVCETLARTVGSCNVLPTISLPFPYHSTHLLCGLDLDSWLTGYTEMCIQESEVGGAEVDGFKSYAPFSLPRALYSSGVACSHIKSSPTCSAVEVIRRPYISSRFSALYLAHSFSVRLLTSGEAIPNRRNDRIVARTLMLCCC